MFVLKGLLLYVKLIYCKVNIYLNLSILGYCKITASDMHSKCTISVHLAKSVAELEFFPVFETSLHDMFPNVHPYIKLHEDGSHVVVGLHLCVCVGLTHI